MCGEHQSRKRGRSCRQETFARGYLSAPCPTPLRPFFNATMSGSGEAGGSGLKQMAADESNVTPSLADCATCGMCNKPVPKSSTLWCEDCALMYCEPCAKQRHAKGALRRHVLKPLAELRSAPPEPAQRMCEYCDGEMAQLHCSAC